MANADRHDVTFETGFDTPGRRYNNWTALVPPTALDDITRNYEEGSRWLVPATGELYTCVRADLGIAGWELISADTRYRELMLHPSIDNPPEALHLNGDLLYFISED